MKNKTVKKPELPHWSEQYHYGGELFAPVLAVFVVFTALLTAGSVWFSSVSAVAPYKTLKCKAGLIQYGSKCFGETTLLIQASADTVAVLRGYFNVPVKYLPLVKSFGEAGLYGKVAGKNIFVPSVRNFLPLANNQYTTRAWQLNEVSRLAAKSYFNQFAEKLKLKHFNKLPAWFSEGLYEWSAHSAFRRVAGKNLDAAIATIPEHKVRLLADYFKNLKNKDEINAKALALMSRSSDGEVDAAIGREKYEAASFYFIKTLADKYGREKLRDFVVQSADTLDIDGAMFSVYAKNLSEFRAELLAGLEKEFTIYPAIIEMPPVSATTTPEVASPPVVAPTSTAVSEPDRVEGFITAANTYFGNHPAYNCRNPLYTDLGSGRYLIGCATTAAVWRWYGVEELAVKNYKNLEVTGNLGLFGTTSYGNNIGVYVLGDDPREALAAQCPALANWESDCVISTLSALGACEVAGRSSAECDFNAAVSGREKVYLLMKVVDPSTASAAKGEFNNLKYIKTK